MSEKKPLLSYSRIRKKQKLLKNHHASIKEYDSWNSFTQSPNPF